MGKFYLHNNYLPLPRCSSPHQPPPTAISCSFAQNLRKSSDKVHDTKHLALLVVRSRPEMLAW